MSATSKVVYPPLGPAERSFRLLRVLPSRSRSRSPIQCELFTADFEDYIDKFTALSYVWGPPEPSSVITVNEAELVVRKNLEHFLEAIRARRKSRIVWVDAVCINQQDAAERSSQVQMMGDIYASAKMVYSFLGHGHRAEATLKSIKSKWLLHRYNRENTKRSWNKLSQADYWTRLWIVQEFTLAKKICFVAGHTMMPFSYDDYRSARYGSVSPRTMYPNLVTRLQEAPVQSRSMAGMIEDHQSGVSKSYTGNFEELFDLYGTLHCAIPQDRVFALLGLLLHRSTEGIQKEDSTKIAKLIDYTVLPWDLLLRILQLRHLLLSEPLRFTWHYNLHVIQGSQDDGMSKRIRLDFRPLVELPGSPAIACANEQVTNVQSQFRFRKVNFQVASCEDAHYTAYQYTWSNCIPGPYVLVELLHKMSPCTRAEAKGCLAHTCVMVELCGGGCNGGCQGHAIIGFAQVYTTSNYDESRLTASSPRNCDARICYDDDPRLKSHPGKYLPRLLQMNTLPELPCRLECAPLLFHTGCSSNDTKTRHQYWLSTTMDALMRLSSSAVKIEDAFMRTYT